MSVLDDLERLDAERPAPPLTLYKYVVPDRRDVLKNGQIRFTPPINTNDIFEVRQTFDLIIGPKMHEAFKEMSKELDFDEALTNAIKDSPLAGITNEDAKALYALATGGSVEAEMRRALSDFIDIMPETMNTPERIDQLLDKMASGILLLSLTERPDSSPMWAHYAANSAGFVIAFDTNSPFFHRGEHLERQGLHKVIYFDGRIPEIAQNPFASLISKQADWAYEREWRLYIKPDQVTRVLDGEAGGVQLVSFPREAVQRVILGTKASERLQDQLAAVLAESYPGVPLTRMKADRTTVSLLEEGV